MTGYWPPTNAENPTGILNGFQTRVVNFEANSIQALAIMFNPVSGFFKLVFNGVHGAALNQKTPWINYNDGPAAVKAALESLAGIAPGDVRVTGGPFPNSVIYVEFTGAYKGKKMEPLVPSDEVFLGSTPGFDPYVEVADYVVGGPSGYDVLAIATQFPPGYAHVPRTALYGATEIPFWGSGAGDLIVDYEQTSWFIWNTVANLRPTALMSFSRGDKNTEWTYEHYSRNLGQKQWLHILNFPRKTGPGTTTPDLKSWCPPQAGGSSFDFSPHRATAVSEVGVSPSNDLFGPPDPTKNAYRSGATSTQRAQPTFGWRASTLPMASMRQALLDYAAQSYISGVTPIIRSYDSSVNTHGEPVAENRFPGGFVSEFMAYHVCWYQAFSQTQAVKCLHAGHTHVGIDVQPANGQAAVFIQLHELLHVLQNP